jgi:hypothetical protein
MVSASSQRRLREHLQALHAVDAADADVGAVWSSLASIKLPEDGDQST